MFTLTHVFPIPVFTPWHKSFEAPQFEWGASANPDPFDTTFIGSANGQSFYKTAAGASRYKVIAVSENDVQTKVRMEFLEGSDCLGFYELCIEDCFFCL